MSRNIGFSRNLILNIRNKLELSQIVRQEKSQKSLLTVIESQILQNLQKLEIDSEISHFGWTLHNGKRKIYIENLSDSKKNIL